jgi:hypothetical protein
MAYISRSGLGSILYTQTGGGEFFHFRRKLYKSEQRLRRMARGLLRRAQRQAEPEIPPVAFIAAVWAYEKNGVQDLLQEAFSSRPADCGARAIGTSGRLIEDRHDALLPV